MQLTDSRGGERMSVHFALLCIQEEGSRSLERWYLAVVAVSAKHLPLRAALPLPPFLVTCHAWRACC